MFDQKEGPIRWVWSLVWNEKASLQRRDNLSAAARCANRDTFGRGISGHLLSIKPRVGVSRQEWRLLESQPRSNANQGCQQRHPPADWEGPEL